MEKNSRILKDYAVIILAAGFSGRMGVPKLSLPYDQHRNFATKIIHTYLSAGCGKVVMVVNRQGHEILKQQNTLPTDNNVSVVLNAYPERERFFSLQTGLKSLLSERPVFIQNIDNPFVHPELLYRLAASLDSNTFVVPVYDNCGGHPVLLSDKIVSAIISFPDYRQNLRNFLQHYSRINCPVEDEKILVNINSQEVYKQYFGGI